MSENKHYDPLCAVTPKEHVVGLCYHKCDRCGKFGCGNCCAFRFAVKTEESGNQFMKPVGNALCINCGWEGGAHWDNVQRDFYTQKSGANSAEPLFPEERK